MSIMGEVVTTSGLTESLLETILEVSNTPIELDIVEKMTRIWNQVEMSFKGEVITTSGFAEVIL